MELTTIWFVAIAFFWVGYFALEGFDFGVGMLLPVLARDETERRVLINTIGPVWDGNEVWLLVAGGATFAAFPRWYATLFSGFYLPLLLILVALIARGVAFEYRHQRDDQQWVARWDRAITYGSLVPTILWGVAFANIAAGVPIDADMEFTGSLLTLLNPFGLLGALVFLSLFVTHGATFIALKTVGDIRERARDLAWRSGSVAAVLTTVFLVWLQAKTGTSASAIVFAVAAVLLVIGVRAAYLGREGVSFAGTFGAIALAVAGIFTALFPDVMPSTTDVAFSLTTTNAAATDYSLTIMSWAGAIFTPLVIGYQAWSYWVFRRRIGTQHIPTPQLAGQ